MKRNILCLLTAAAIVMSFGVSAFASAQFADLDSGHWAYTYVDTLVTKGTVKGYEDGSFRPDNTVTRAEFAKMLGKPDNAEPLRAYDYRDVTSEHWAYEYVKYFDIGEFKMDFEPDNAITRFEAIYSLWARAGYLTGYQVPAVISNQAAIAHVPSVSWAYATGLVVGDDGLNLRLKDNISRAEAAALICRFNAQDNNKKIDFANTVDEKILKNVYEKLALFDDSPVYNPSETFTYGEIAKAALRLSLDEHQLTYENYSNLTTFEHKYAVDMYILGSIVWGEDTINAQYADQTAQKIPALAAFSFAASRKDTNPTQYVRENTVYDDAVNNSFITGNVQIKNHISNLYRNGVSFYADNKLKPEGNITAKDIALLLIQINEYVPLGISRSSERGDNGEFKKTNEKLELNAGAFPSNYEAYGPIYSTVPAAVYEYPFSAGGEGKQYSDPQKEYFVGLDMLEGFAAQMAKVADKIKADSGAEVVFNVYPNLIYNNGKAFSLRVKCLVLSNPRNLTASELVDGLKVIYSSDNSAKAGDSFFIECSIPYLAFMS